LNEKEENEMDEYRQFIKEKIYDSEINQKEFSKWMFIYDNMKEKTY
jgi:hypothetical protein